MRWLPSDDGGRARRRRHGVVRSFDAAPESVGLARRFVAEHVAAWGLTPDEAVQVVAELAAEAWRGHRAFTVQLVRRTHALLIEVADAGAHPPFANQVGRYAPSRRALEILDRCSEHWGSTLGEASRTVWASLPARRAPRHDPLIRRRGDRRGPSARRLAAPGPGRLGS